MKLDIIKVKGGVHMRKLMFRLCMIWELITAIWKCYFPDDIVLDEIPKDFSEFNKNNGEA